MSQAQNSQESIQAIKMLRDSVGNGPLSIFALSDEELAVLESAEEVNRQHLVAPLHWYHGHNKAERELLRNAALRSLTVRGLAFVKAPPNNEQLNLALDAQLHAVLTMRQAMSSLLIVNRADGDNVRHRVLFGQAPNLMLEEDITGHGLHSFTLAPTTAIAERLTRYTDPEASADKRTAYAQEWLLRAEEITPENFTPVNEARYVTALRRDDLVDGKVHTRRWVIYTLSDRVIFGKSQPTDNEDALHLRDMTNSELLHQLNTIVE